MQCTEIDVKFGDVSIQKTTARISMVIERTAMGYPDALQLLCGSRVELVARVVVDGDDKDQQFFDGMRPPPLESVVDIKRFGTTPTQFTASLTFALKEIATAQLAKFVHRPAKVELRRIGDIPAEETELMRTGPTDETTGATSEDPDAKLALA